MSDLHNADIDTIGEALVSSMPDVQEHAVAQAQQLEQSSIDNSPRDKNGTPFDPSLHSADATGQGKLTAGGTWAKKRGRKNVTTAHNAGGSMLDDGSADQAAAVEVQQTNMQARVAGTAAAEMLFTAGQIIGGEEWAPSKNDKIGLDERMMMQSAFAEYFVAKGAVDIPPGVILSFAILAYAAPRFAMPKTQSRFEKFKSWAVTWWTNRKLRKMGLELQVTPKKSENK